jgi:urea transport system permease protein
VAVRKEIVSLTALTLVVSAGLLSPRVAAAAPGAAGLAVGPIASRLAEPATQREAIEALRGLTDPAVEVLLRALKDGALYRWNAGVAVLGDDGALRDTAGQPIRDARGQPVLPREGQEAIALEESSFGLVQEILERLQIFKGDPEGRRSAAFKLGSSRDPAAIPVLVKALDGESDARTRTVLAEALAKLQLLAPDAATRALAARALGRLRSESALAELTAALEREADPPTKQTVRDAIQSIESFVFLRGVVGYLFNGVSLGAVLLIMSLGLAVTFGLMGIINMAHGEMLMIGSYTAYVAQELFAARFASHLDYYFVIALPLSFLIAGLVGLLLELGIIRHLYGRPLETLIVTWGIGMIFSQSARLWFGDQTSVNPPTWFRGGIEVLRGLIFPWSRIFIVILALAALAALSLLLRYTYAGLRVQAVMQNRPMAACLGVSTRRIDALTFALGTGLAGIGGCALALIGTVDPEVGKTYIVDAFMVVVLGGVGKLVGAVVASFGIGLANKLLEPAIGGTAGAIYAKVAVLAIVIWFLQWKPTGLFPARGRAAAEAAETA